MKTIAKNVLTWEQWYSASPAPYYAGLDDPADPIGGRNYRILDNSNGGYTLAQLEQMLCHNNAAKGK